MSRPHGPMINVARTLHERLLILGLHPQPPRTSHKQGKFNEHTSPCDGCYDLADEVAEAVLRPAYGALAKYGREREADMVVALLSERERAALLVMLDGFGFDDPDLRGWDVLELLEAGKRVRRKLSGRPTGDEER